MLDNWIKPVSLFDITGSHEATPNSWADMISYGDQTDFHIALIGVGEHDANEVRRALYAMSFPFEKLKVADLGNMRNIDPAFIMAPLRELIQDKRFPILIGHDFELVRGLYRALLSLQDWINFSLVDQVLRLNNPEDALQDILVSQDARLFHMSMIGCQSHAMLPQHFAFLESRFFDIIRLGEAKNSIQTVEPIVRDADVAAFNINAIRHGDAPGQPSPTPSGFSSDEACQIARYIGMSDKIKCFGIFGFSQQFDNRNQTAMVIAQMIWYATEGFYHRTGDFPVTTQGLSEYLVAVKSVDFPLCFWKSEKSGRWWMQISDRQRKGIPTRHRLIPCSYNDYKSACNDDLPDRLVQALKRFT
jgi:formiminoglutamase